MREIHRLLRPCRQALGRAYDAIETLDRPAARTTHDRALADLRAALMDLQDAAEDARVALPEEVPT